nr:aldolase catalytic domain-containing protein [uncultured Sellimonas sp.]
MNNVKVLDCTLRDGGYINHWKFGKKTIKAIVDNLVSANIDIVETGFIRNVEYEENSSVFSSVDQIKEVITPKVQGTLYAAMIEQQNYDGNLISNYDGSSIDMIRLTFHKAEWEETKKTIKELMAKGYKVCVQPVGTVAYEDQALLNLLRDVNEIKPYAFYLVDTLGVMYRHDMRRLFYLIDNNLSQDICLGFHSHNNLQMSFANAQEMVRLNHKRTVIVDASCYGMGRGVGNLSTELFIDYINNNIEQKYSLIPILNIVDKYLMPIYAEQRWGYDLPYFLSATAKCHPNYAAYLLQKETLGIEKIEKLLSLIPKDKRNEYNAELIETLYLKMQAFDVDDSAAYKELKRKIDGKEVVILGSGSSIVKDKEKIQNIIKDKYVISTNFIISNYKIDALFISNDKRLGTLDLNSIGQVLAVSNLKDDIRNGLIFNYASLLGEGDASDNAGAMLIRVLKNAGVKKIYLAGFDGFEIDASVNYAVQTYKKSLDYDTAKKKNEDISKQLKLALSGVDYEVLTETKYEIGSI